MTFILLETNISNKKNPQNNNGDNFIYCALYNFAGHLHLQTAVLHTAWKGMCLTNYNGAL